MAGTLGRLRRLFRRRWFQVVAHLVTILGLVATLGASAYAERYFTRGVISEPDATVIPHTDVNPLGVNTFLNEEADPAKVERTLDMIADAGFTYVRQIFPWYDIEQEPGSYWDANHDVSSWTKYDRIVELADLRGLEIIARLDKPPRWARAGQPDLDRFPDGPPNRIEDFASFVSTLVDRYRGKINYVQIWNEPNLEGEWGGQPIDPAAFTELLKAAYTAAKAANSEVTVLMPGLAPTDQRGPDNLSDLLFLQGMYDAGAKDYFDIATVMVYGYGFSPSDRRVGFARNNFSRPIQTREIMVRNGDTGKPVWAAEYGWVSLPDDWAGAPSPWGKPIDPATQARYLFDGYLRAQREWPWMGVMCIWHFRWLTPPDHPDDQHNPTRGFAIVDFDFTPRPAYRLLAERGGQLRIAYTGSYPAGSHTIDHGGQWTLTGPADALVLAPNRAGATLRIPFSGTSIDLLLDGSGTGFSATIDGRERGLVGGSNASASAERITIADDLDDRTHMLELTALGATDQSRQLTGFVVGRRTIHDWIYRWIDAVIGALLLLNLASLSWMLRRFRSRAGEPATETPVLRPAELRERRTTRTQRTKSR